MEACGFDFRRKTSKERKFLLEAKLNKEVKNILSLHCPLSTRYVIVIATVVISIFSAGVFNSVQRAFGHGVHSEAMTGLVINGREVSLSPSTSPPFLTTENSDIVALNLRLFEVLDNSTIPQVSYSIRVIKDGEIIMDEVFHSHIGPLTMNIIPKDGSVTIIGDKDAEGVWQTESGKVALEGAIFLKGGLHEFQIEILNVDQDNSPMQANFPPIFNLLIGVGDIFENDLIYENRKYNITMISYYDKIDGYVFDSSSNTIHWSMPFNWDIDFINSQPIHVHEEIHVPKSLISSINSTSFFPSVNGIAYTSGIALDPYTSDQHTIVHYIIDKATIIELAKIGAAQARQNASGQEEPKFSIGDKMIFALAFNSPRTLDDFATSSEITTSSETLHIHLSWEPDQLSPDTQSILRLRFDPIIDGASSASSDTDVRYNLRLIDSLGNEISTRESLIANNSSDVQTLNFPANDVYSIEVNITGIRQYGDEWDQSKNGIAVGTVVVPEFTSMTMLAAIISFLGVLVITLRCSGKLSSI